LIPGKANYFWGMVRVFGVVAMTALIVGVAALAIAFAVVDADTVNEISRYGNEIDDDVAFARAGTMHNFSYLGGLAGIITGGVAIFRQRRRLSASASTVDGDTDATEQRGEPARR
jgi:hypothetical protein